MSKTADQIGSILVIATKQLGDVLMTTPLIREAKRRWPQAQVDVLGFAGTLVLLRGNPDIRELIEVPAKNGWRHSRGLVRRLWRKYDLALIAQYTDRAHLYGLVAARRRSGLITLERKSWWKRALLDHAVVVCEGSSHVVLEKLKLLAPYGVVPHEVSVQPPPSAELPADVVSRLRPGYVVMQTPSLVRYKRWPALNYAEVARVLASRGHQVLLTGSALPQDRETVAEVMAAADSPDVVDLSGRLDLPQMVTLLSGAALYLGPDTSITHLAAACRVPVVALYGPIAPRQWGPWPSGWGPDEPFVKRAERQRSGNVIVLQGMQHCVPCNREGCERHRDSRSDCLDTMAPQRVLREALSILERGSPVL